MAWLWAWPSPQLQSPCGAQGSSARFTFNLRESSFSCGWVIGSPFIKYMTRMDFECTKAFESLQEYQGMGAFALLIAAATL